MYVPSSRLNTTGFLWKTNTLACFLLPIFSLTFGSVSTVSVRDSYLQHLKQSQSKENSFECKSAVNTHLS